MIKKILSVLLFAFLLALIACSEQTAGVTEEENPIAFEVKEPDYYDLWTFDNQISINTSGYWFDASDLDKELLATITYPVLEGKIMGDNLMDAAASMCGGICGTVEFADSPKRVLSTNIGYSVRKDGSTVDASSWKGLCVTYESDFDMKLKFSSGKNGIVAGSDMPFAEFPKLAKLGTRCAKWENFKQNNLNEITSEEVAKKMGAVFFEFTGKAKQKGSFFIKGLSSYKDVKSQQVELKKGNASCMWRGFAGDLTVNTGFDSEGSLDAGKWYSFDSPVNPGATVNFQLPKEVGGYQGDLTQVIAYYKSLRGNVPVPLDDMNAGVGFYIAGTENGGNMHQAVDITDWGGLCVTYSSNMDIIVEVTDRYGSELLHFSNLLDASDSIVEKCHSWDEFLKDSLYKDIIKSARYITFNFFRNKESGDEVGFFKFVGVGKYNPNGACYLDDVDDDTGSRVVSSSSSKAVSSSSSQVASCSSVESSNIRLFKNNDGYEDVCSFNSVNDLWYGVDRYPVVSTELANETETAGYWYNFGYMSDDGMGAQFTWPTVLGNGYDEMALDSVIDFCAGICAEMYYKKDTIAGVAFNIVGEISITDNSLMAGDASSWGGLCVTYAADADMDVVMIGPEKNESTGQIQLQPKVTLPKSIDVTTKCVEWDDFVSSDGKTSGNASSLMSLMFGFYGVGGQYIRFNIMGLGRYHRLSNPECTAKENFVSKN
ncbi:MAG: hypothetical protein J6W51_01300 [Fibrobacter sp.]|nr:hypothetical protein [Fibrobacter sp.]